MNLPLSVLDLAPVNLGETAAAALRRTVELARLAERLGHVRYWLAEHHNMAGVASAAPEVLIGHVASATGRIRVGSGGIMLPNHVPLQLAEQFQTLAALHPGRIDLGLGRAPGTDPAAVRARRWFGSPPQPASAGTHAAAAHARATNSRAPKRWTSGGPGPAPAPAAPRGPGGRGSRRRPAPWGTAWRRSPGRSGGPRHAPPERRRTK